MKTWILQRFQVYARVAILIAVFLSPVLFHRGTQDVFNLLKFTIIWIFGLAAAALWLVWSSERGVWIPVFRIGVLIVPYLVVCVIATIASENPALSLIGLYHRYGGLIPFTLYAITMIAIVGLYWERPADLKDIPKASLGAAVLLTTYVLIQAAGQDWIPWQDPNGGPPPFPVGTMGNSNFAGAYLGISLPFCLYLALTAKGEVLRAIGLAFVALDLLALWFTQTRGGMIAAGAGLVAMVFVYRDKLPAWARISTVISVGLAAVLAVLILWHPGADAPPGPLAQIKTFRTETFSVRTFYWTTAIRIFKEHPVTGVGLDQYYANYPQFRLREDGAQLGLTITDKPHNIFLEYLANAGLAGLASYLLLVGGALYFGYRRARDPAEPNRALLVTFVGVLAGYLAQGFFSIDVPPLAWMGWIAIAGIAVVSDPRLIQRREALLAAARDRSKGKPKGKKARQPRQVVGSRIERRGPTRWAVHAPVAVCLALLMVVGIRPLYADVKAKQAAVAQSSKGPDSQIEGAYEDAIALHPLESSYRGQLGAWYFAKAREATDPKVKKSYIDKAIVRYEEALRLQSGNVFFLLNLAEIHTHWAESIDKAHYRVADMWWKRVVEHDPNDYMVHNSYAQMLINYSNAEGGDATLRRRSAAELEAALAIKPDLVDSWINLGKVYQALGETEKARRALRRALELSPTNPEATTLLQSVTTPTSTSEQSS